MKGILAGLFFVLSIVVLFSLWGADFTGDGTNDIAIFRPSTGLWAVRGITRFYYGTWGDKPIPGDYTGDGTSEIGIFRPDTSLWSIRGLTRVYFGGSDDVIVYGGGGGGRGPQGPPGTSAWEDGTGVVTTEGSVGIGVEDPQYSLDVEGQIVGRFTPGNLVLGITRNGGTSNNWDTKVAEFLIGQGGTIRTVFTLRTTGPTAFGQIYVNDSPRGQLRWIHSGMQEFQQDIGGLVPGDRIQLYMRSGTAENFVEYRDFKLQIGAGIFCTYIPPAIYN